MLEAQILETRHVPGYVHPVLHPSQSRAARALLGWTQQQLADEANLRVLVIRRFEAGRSDPRSTNRDRIERALVRAGIELSEEDGLGVKLRRIP
jgi:ribosome-binding protein aMBF1 (putative translation factor)